MRRSLAKGGRLKARKGYKFSNTAVGRAMQRQYDKEQGIVMQKVIPEIEVFPNYYDLNENGYGNSFAIDKDRRPKTFAQNGETTTPYTPLRLDEQNWLNRTLGINHFGIGLLNFVINPSNVVPVSKTTQGIEALASMSRGTAPVAIENEVAPKMITYAPKVEQNARLDLLERNPSRISEAERAGVPKGDRNLKTVDRPNRWFPEITESNAHRVSDAQWDAAYNKAVADNNTAEVQKLRDLHFYAKTGETPTIMYRGSVNPTLRNTYYRDDGSAVWLTPDYEGAAYYRPHGTERPPRAHYVKTRDGNILHIDGGGNMWSNIPPENVPEEVIRHLGDPKESNGLLKLFPIGYDTGDIVHGAKLAGYKQVDFQNIIDAKKGENYMSKNGVYPQFTTRYYNNIKLADPITYDDAGNIIPLSKRDNFSSNDIRWSWLPWVLGGSTIGYNYSNNFRRSLEDFIRGPY